MFQSWLLEYVDEKLALENLEKRGVFWIIGVWMK
jgi:hypothetical protein